MAGGDAFRRHPASSMIAVFLCSLVSAFSMPARPLAEVREIRSVELVERTGGVDLEIAASGAMAWAAAERPDGSLVIRLPDVVPAESVSSLTADRGLVAAVEISVSSADPPETRIVIRTRQKAKYSVSSAADRMTVRLTARAAEGLTAAGTPRDSSAGGDRIGPGDVLNVDVFGLDDLDRKVRVEADGTISLPLLGTLLVAGLELRTAENRIARLLKERDLVKEPQVSIFVDEFVNRSISVQGAVHNPGTYQLVGTRTLLEIIGQAGGMDERAGGDILVLRNDDQGRQYRIEIDAERLVVEADPSANIALAPGDIVMVSHSRTVRIYVSGAVRNPGAVEFLSGEGITVLQAITAAGGPTNRANLKNTHILRRGPDGTQEKIAVNIKKIRKGKVEDVLLRKNDTVVVGEWFF